MFRVVSAASSCVTAFNGTQYRSSACVRTLVTLANRKYLPGSDAPDFPKFLRPPREDFPKVLNWWDNQFNSAIHDPKKLGSSLRGLVDEEITKYPALLLKRLPCQTPSEVDEFMSGLGYDYLPYVGGLAVRDQLSSNVSTASREPREMCIEPHNEMAYQPTWPKMFMLFCETPPPPGTGGETVIVNVRDLERGLDGDVLARFRERGVRYIRCMADRLSQHAWYHTWQESFQCEAREEAERALRRQGVTYEWRQDGTLKTYLNLPAMSRHYRTGELVWFNQAQSHHFSYLFSNPKWSLLDFTSDEAPFHTAYGDGSEIEDDVLQHIRNVTWDVAVGWQMERGDLLILDNMLVQHARLSFTDKRKLLASLVKMDTGYFENDIKGQI